MKNLSNEALSILNSNGFKASNEEMEKISVELFV